MTSPPQRTFVQGAPAAMQVRADLHHNSDAAPVIDVPVLTQHSSAFELEDYAIVYGYPAGRPPLQARAVTACGIGNWDYSGHNLAPLDVNLQAAARWLPTDSTFNPAAQWSPTIGEGPNFIFDPTTAPYLDDGYSYASAGGEQNQPALIFSGDAWAELDDAGWSAQAFSFVMVAVMYPNTEGDSFGILESSTLNNPPILSDPTLPMPDYPNDWGLRYRSGSVYFWAGASMLRHPIAFPQARAVLIGIALDGAEGKFIVKDANGLTTELFDAGGLNVFDLQLFLGRTGTAFDTGATAQMALLDLAYFDRSLTFEQLSEVTHLLNAVYGISA